jgi:hypothetical protein
MTGRTTLLLLLAGPLHAQVDAWELPPVKYSETPASDAMARLAAKWAENPATLTGRTPLERVREILASLHVPEASQLLVFSKTSKQNALITPANPRALFYSMNCYCGYVPGGVMEIAIQDPRLGPVFYHVELGNPTSPMRVERDTNDCLSCHATGRTENVPGLLVRSVYPDDTGNPLLSLGSFTVNGTTPIAERWGGYYVTGVSQLPHLGNRIYAEDRSIAPAAHQWENLQGKIDLTKYPRSTSDIVSLMVVEHQIQAHNLLTAATMNYNRAQYLAEAVNPESDPDEGTAGRIAEDGARRIVECLLFAGEANIGSEGVEGDETFQRQFQEGVPRTKSGESLGDFQLNTRLFKNRCSYMVYSEAFRGLPATVKTRVVAGLRAVLEAAPKDDAYGDMKASERRRVLAILEETEVF